MVKISSIFVAFLEYMNFNYQAAEQFGLDVLGCMYSFEFVRINQTILQNLHAKSICDQT